MDGCEQYNMAIKNYGELGILKAQQRMEKVVERAEVEV